MDICIEKPIVKIIVPVFNTALHLRKCLDSIIAQSYKYYYLILIDDGSSDGSEKICDEYQKKDSRVFVIHQSNKGLSHARNRGIDYDLKCKYLTFIDSDDLVHPKYLEYLVLASEKNGCQIAISKHIRFGKNKPINLSDELKINVYSPEQCYCSKEISTTPVWGKLFAYSLLPQLRFPEGKIHEDYYVTWKVIFSVDKIAVIDNCLYYYYCNPYGIMHSQWNPRRMDIFPALDEKMEFFKKRGFFQALKRATDKKEKVIDKYLKMLVNSPYENEFKIKIMEMKGDANVQQDDRSDN